MLVEIKTIFYENPARVSVAIMWDKQSYTDILAFQETYFFPILRINVGQKLNFTFHYLESAYEGVEIIQI